VKPIEWINKYTCRLVG